MALAELAEALDCRTRRPTRAVAAQRKRMTVDFVKFEDVTFGYPGASELLFKNMTLHAPAGWSGVVGANGAGKTTLLLLASRLLEPDSGRIEGSARAIYCPQRTDDPPGELEHLLTCDEPNAC